MKKHVFTLLALIFFAGISCQEKIDIEKENEAIKAVIDGSAKSYHARDFEGIASAWVHDETAIRLNAAKGGFGYTVGWEKQDLRYKTMFKDNPEPSTNKEVNSNYYIKVFKEGALAVYDTDMYNSAEELIRKSIHTTFLEKDNGQWKIAYLSTVITSSYNNAEENKRISSMYHDTNPDNVDMILTEEFSGFNEEYGNTWNKENHRNFLTNHPEIKDTVYNQIGEGDLVATRFTRSMNYQGKNVNIDVLHIKRFQDGKIAEIWEYSDTKQVD